MQANYNQEPPAVQLPRTLHLYSDGAFTSSSGHIKDADKSVILYTYEIHSMSKPNITLRTGNGGHEIGTANLHSFSSKVDINCHGQSIQSDTRGFFKSWRQYASPAIGGQILEWGKKSGDLVCRDTEKQTKAYFESSSFAMTKLGKLHLDDPGFAMDGPAMDEMVLNALVAIVEEENSHASHAAASAGGGGGG